MRITMHTHVLVLSIWKRQHNDVSEMACESSDSEIEEGTRSSSVFSLLSNSFSSRQDSSLEDYIEPSVMMQYNNR